jgi:hypothetical protein
MSRETTLEQGGRETIKTKIDEGNRRNNIYLETGRREIRKISIEKSSAYHNT